jgi:hypothetical protein
MEGLKFFLDGNEIKLLPQGWKDIEIQLSFGDATTDKISVENFEFNTLQELTATEDPVDLINAWIAGGNNGTTGGLLEGMPYAIKLECDGSTDTVYNGILNLASKSAQYSCDRIIVPSREIKGQDYLNEVADSFRFEYLARGLSAGDAGFISTSDYIQIWYQVGKYPQGAEIFMASITLYLIIRELADVIEKIADAVAAVVGGATGAAEFAIQLAALIVYLVSLIIALVNLINKLIELIFPWVYYHNAMYAKTLCQKACDYMGLGFSSTILTSTLGNAGMYIMPKKDIEGQKVGVINAEQGYYSGTFGQLLEDLQIQTDGIPKVINGTLFFETEDWYQNQSNYHIPDMEVELVGYNGEDIPSNYHLTYQNDNADLYNYDEYTGTDIVATTVLDNIVTPSNTLLTGLVDNQIPFTLPNVKTQETQLENTMAGIYNAWASLVNFVTSITNPSAAPTLPPIPSSTTEILKLDTHFTSVNKVGVQTSGGGTGKTTSQSNVMLGAKKLFEDYHSQNIGKPIYGYQGNQWKLYKAYKIPLCCEDFAQLKDNNYCKYLGNDAKIISMNWNPYDEVADIDFMVREQYVTGMTVNLVYDGGESGTASL